MEKFKNKYRVPSARLQHWDYRWVAAYFITICTKDKVHYFGEIKNGKMVLSHAGILANVLWYEIKNHAHHVNLGEFVVMPNHIHGILILNDNDTNIQTTHPIIVETTHPIIVETTHPIAVETTHALSLPPTIGQTRFQNQGKNSISSIVGGYKSAVTKHANRLGLEFGWQSRFHDHVIRNEESFLKISNYIINNPQNWNIDKFYGNDPQ